MIYNAFMFYDEFDLLDIRLKELSGLVDRFVLIESNRTYTGKPKPLYFCENSERYVKYADRIVHIIACRDTREQLRETVEQAKQTLRIITE